MTSGSPEQALALRYAPAQAQQALAALLALDDTLGHILRTTREPIVGQMRLTWWHEALTKLDTAPPPAEPVLQALATSVVPTVGGVALATMIDGWEALLEPMLDDDALALFATSRGGRLFTAMARICGVEDARIAMAGEGWALADLSRRMSDPTLADRVRDMARTRIDAAMVGVWPRDARALGALALLARDDLRTSAPAVGSPRRIGRILIHQLTGR